jgi:hypothetical protein
MSETVVCPDCGARLPVPPHLDVGGRFECPHCAGTWLEWQGGGRVRRVEWVSCPEGDEVLEVPPDARPGDRMVCAGKTWRLTYEFGAWALEPVETDAPPGR